MFNQNIVVLNLRVGMFGVNRQTSSSFVEPDADKNLIKVYKQLLASPEYERIESIKRKLTAALRKLAIPGQLSRRGMYPIHLSLVPRADELIDEFTVDFLVAVEGFCSAYEDRRTEAETRLASLHDPADYPPITEVRKCFFIKTNYLTISVPVKLSQVREDLLVREQAKSTVEWSEFRTEARAAMRLAMKKLIDGLAAALGTNGEGRKMALKDGAVKDLKEFLDTFEFRDAGDDTELQEMVARVREFMAGNTPDLLRKDQNLRDYARMRMEEVAQELDSLVEEAPSRTIVLVD